MRVTAIVICFICTLFLDVWSFPQRPPVIVLPTYSPPHPPPLLAPLLSRPPLVLVVRHARGIPCHSCHVKECSQKPGDVFFFFFCRKHLNMHPSLPSLNHMVGSEIRAHLTRTRTNRSASLRTCVDEIKETGAQWFGASS